MTDIFTAPADSSQQMADSLPEGKAWGSKNVDDSNVRKLINALAVAPNAAQQQIQLLADEFNINKTVQLLPDFETSVGEPDSCSTGVLGSLAERRETVIEKLRKTPTVTLAEMQAYIDRKVPETEVRLIPASTLQPAYASTENNDLTVAVGTDAFYAATVGNDLTRSTNPTPHYIAATVGNDALVTDIGSGFFIVDDANDTFVIGDVGKIIIFINTNGSIVGYGLIDVFEPVGFPTAVRATIFTGTIPTGTITGGFWGFDTEPVVDDGDYFMTAAAPYPFAIGDIGDQIDVIDALGNVILEFEIMSFTSTTVVGVNLISGSLVATVYTGGTWDFTGGAITPAADYNLVSSSSYFVIGDIASIIRIIDTAGDEVATMTISGFTSDTQVAATLSSGTIAEGVIAGGLWGFNTETPINIFLSNPKFILIAEVVGVGEQFEYDFEIPFANGIDASRVTCVMNKIMPSNVILLIQFVPE
jgi:hypothetical protein